MDFYQYAVWVLNEMHKALVWQIDKISKIEKDMERIREQLVRLEALPRTNVEKIEYNFEQLKVERLDGTLTIGITPYGTGTIEDLDVHNCHTEDIPLGEQTSVHPLFQQIRDNISRYIRQSVPAIVEEQAKERNIRLASADREMITDDLIKQIDDRIMAYLLHSKHDGQKQESITVQHVLQNLKRDVHAALDQYFSRFGKGEKHE